MRQSTVDRVQSDGIGTDGVESDGGWNLEIGRNLTTLDERIAANNGSCVSSRVIRGVAGLVEQLILIIPAEPVPGRLGIAHIEP